MRNTVRRLVLVVMTMFLYVGLFLSHQQILVQAEQNDNVTFDTKLNNDNVKDLPVETFAFAEYYVLPKGTYYLEKNLVINKPLLIEGDFMDPVYLNLNGHSITLTGQNTEVIRLKGTPSSGSYRMMQTTLHIYDTAGGGNITHESGFTGNGINVGRNAHLYMHGGQISGNNGNYGGGVYLFKSANLHMEGGTITNNTAYEGGGVYLEDATCNVRFSGTFQIVDNYKKGPTRTENNLYLPWGSMLDLYHSSNIDSSSTVRITTQAKPTSTIPTEGVRLWKDRSTEIYENVFVSDDNTYIIHKEGSNGYLTFNQLHSFTVHFETNGGTQLDDKSVAPTSKVPEPTITKTGYRFDGWYTDSGFTKPYNFNNPVLSDLTL